MYGKIKTKERSQLGHSRSDKLVYCKQALNLADKMQTASYKRDVEKWDDDCSDSDSNASDDEADLAV